MKKFISLMLTAILLLSMIPPAAAETGYRQSPFLDGMGLPPVEERLPTDPLIEEDDPPSIGVYSSEMTCTVSGSNWDTAGILEEGLFRFNAEGMVEPNVASGFDVNEDATVYTIRLREGMKWSDGAPFTAEDCVWFYNAICLNNLDSKGVRSCHRDANGAPAVVEKVNDCTFTVTFSTPRPDFIEAMTAELKWHYAPKHIFGEMVQCILEGRNKDALAIGRSICGTTFTDVVKMGKELLYYAWNHPGVPTLNPYVLSDEEILNSAMETCREYVRNPYYWKVDVTGQQLPYIDRIIYRIVPDAD